MIRGDLGFLSDCIMHVWSTTGAATVTTLSFAPAAGEEWIVWDAWISHDDPAARDLGFQVYDGASTITIPHTSAVAAGTKCKISDKIATPIILRETEAIVFTASALAAGKKLTGDFLCYQVRGRAPWVNT